MAPRRGGRTARGFAGARVPSSQGHLAMAGSGSIARLRITGSGEGTWAVRGRSC